MRICKLEGCENSLEGMHGSTRYCSERHKDKANYEANRDKKIAAARTCYEVNKDKINAGRRAYYEANKEKIKAQQKAYREANKEKIKAQQKAWREDNREHIRSYFETNKEKFKAYSQRPEVKLRRIIRWQRYESIKNSLPATFTDADWKRLLIDFGGYCVYCGRPFDDTPHMDHFIPVEMRGPFTADNILLVCGVCNSSKRDRLPEEYLPPELYRDLKDYLDGQKEEYIQLELQWA